LPFVRVTGRPIYGPDRICQRIWLPHRPVNDCIDDQFPILESLFIDSQDRETSLILPQSFQAPSLCHFRLCYIAFPIRSPLLTATGGLVSLRLRGIPRSGYFPPGYILTRLSLMPQLESHSITFHSPVPNRDVIRQLSEIPIMTHVTLPSLRWFGFGGDSAYLEGLLERITGIHCPCPQNPPSQVVQSAHLHCSPTLAVPANSREPHISHFPSRF
jgi:hypothetical protein